MNFFCSNSPRLVGLCFLSVVCCFLRWFAMASFFFSTHVALMPCPWSGLNWSVLQIPVYFHLIVFSLALSPTEAPSAPPKNTIRLVMSQTHPDPFLPCVTLSPPHYYHFANPPEPFDPSPPPPPFFCSSSGENALLFLIHLLSSLTPAPSPHRQFPRPLFFPPQCFIFKAFLFS